MADIIETIVVKAEADFTPDPDGHSFKITAPGLEGLNVTDVVISSKLKFAGNLSYKKVNDLLAKTTKVDISYSADMFQIIFSNPDTQAQVGVFQSPVIVPKFQPDLVDCAWTQT